MHHNKFYVYAHYRADTMVPFYVGKGLKNRHKVRCGRNQYWRNLANKYGFVSDILRYFDNEQDALDYEKEVIKTFIEKGYTLTNLTDGGEGLSGFTHSPDTKEKIGNANRGVPKPPRALEHNAKISASLAGSVITDKTREILRTKAASRVGRVSGNYHGDVIATNVETGEEIRLCGKKEIIAAGFLQSGVSACILGEIRSHKGYIFRREEPPQYNIIATNLTTGECLVLKGKDSLLSAGFNPVCVRRCIIGKLKHHKGYMFRKEIA